MQRSSQSLRVLITSDAVGGVWSYVYELCRALPEVEFMVANMGPRPSSLQAQTLYRLENVELVCGDYRLEWMEAPWDDVTRAGEWLTTLARGRDFDLVHLNGYVHAALDFVAPVLVTAHSCVRTWWRAVHGTDAPASWEEYKRRVQRGLRAAHRVIVPTHAFLDALESAYGPLPHARVINNGLSIPNHVGAHEKEAFVLSAGRAWDEAKNIRVLSDVATRLNWPMYLAGPAVSPDGRHAAPSTLRVLGSLERDEMFRWLACAGVFVSSAVYEPFGYSVLEAALKRCALVLSDIPTFRELWGDAAVYVAPRDSAAIRDALAELIAAPARLVFMARYARARAERYSSMRMALDYLAAYRELAAAKSLHLMNA